VFAAGCQKHFPGPIGFVSTCYMISFMRPAFGAGAGLLILQAPDERFHSTQVVSHESKSGVQVFNFALEVFFALLKLLMNRSNPGIQAPDDHCQLAGGFLSCLGLHIWHSQQYGPTQAA
jgi:hypothetical protein